MEEKKNSAIEKVENISSDKWQSLTEEQKAQVRIEHALEKERIKAQEDKDKTEKQRIKQQQKQERLAQKQELKKAEQERKRMLKEKTAEERATLKKLRQKAKIEKRENLKKETPSSPKHNKNGMSKGRKGWLIAVICLSISTIALATALTLTYLIPQEADVAMENAYAKSFYDTVEQVDNIDLNLSKVLASKDEGAIQKYLLDIAVESELCESDLMLPPTTLFSMIRPLPGSPGSIWIIT